MPLVLLASAAAACGPAVTPPPDEAVARLLHWELAHLDSPLPAWLLFGRYELTHGEMAPNGDAAEAELPAVLISYLDAEAWAHARGLRLPTAAEWRALAGVPESSPGLAPLSHNTLELGLGRALPAGVFERGRSPFGGYDFYGNVRELAGPPRAGRVQALGGSFATRLGRGDLRDDPTLWVEVADRADDLGVRLVADPLPYLRQQVLPAWREDPEGAGDVLRNAARRWRADLRAAFAAHLLAEGFEAAFVALLAP